MPDNIESRMSFIIEQQAQFAVDIQLLKERQFAFAADLQSLKERQAETREMIGRLVDVSMSLARHGEETDRRIRELAEAGTDTDHRLDALIDTVGKLVRRDSP
jgi:phage tail tape-measure protein